MRAKLAEYYDAEGAGDALRIRLAKGGYAPTFERVAATSTPTRRASEATSRQLGGWPIRSMLVVAGLALVAVAHCPLANSGPRGLARARRDRGRAAVPCVFRPR